MIGVDQDLLGMGNDARFSKRGQRLLVGLPERMALRQGQDQIGFQRPVGRTRGVIIFAHRQVRVGKAEGQDPVAIGNRLLLPPAQMTEDNPLHDARREHLQPGEGHCAPEGDHREAVGQAAAKGHRGAVGGRHINKVFGKQGGSLTQHL